MVVAHLESSSRRPFPPSGNLHSGVSMRTWATAPRSSCRTACSSEMTMGPRIMPRVPNARVPPMIERAISHESIDLLLTDVEMGNGINCIELGSRILAERPGLPVLVMSGFPDNESMVAERACLFGEAVQAGQPETTSTRGVSVKILALPCPVIGPNIDIREVLESFTASIPI